MKLRYSKTSPFARKVIVVAKECGLEARIKMDPTNVHAPDTDIAKDNPLGKIPALVLDGGEALYDSPVIAEYLDSLHDGVKLFPAAGGSRWTALRRQALADGVLDAAVLRLLEERRPAAQQSAAWIAKQCQKIEQALDVLEDEAETFAGHVDLGTISIACALGYLDFRFPDPNWRSTRPVLADWFEGFNDRASMQATIPSDG